MLLDTFANLPKNRQIYELIEKKIAQNQQKIANITTQTNRHEQVLDNPYRTNILNVSDF